MFKTRTAVFYRDLKLRGVAAMNGIMQQKLGHSPRYHVNDYGVCRLMPATVTDE